jgi:hypothetical protein
MKRKAIVATALAVLTTGVCSAEVVFKTELKAGVAGMKVYTTRSQEMKFEERGRKLEGVLERAGIKVDRESDNIVRTERFMGFNGDGVEALINVTGSEIVFTYLPGLKLTEKTGELPDEKTAERMARIFLAEAGLVDPERGELVVHHIGGLAQALATPKGTTEPEKKAVAVYFNRELDGFPVMNRGSHITVMIGDAGTPINMQYNWREVSEAVREVKDDEALSPATVRDFIVRDIARVYNLDDTIVITKIYPVYYDRGESFIQPAYCYEGVIPSREEGVVDLPVLGYVAGLKRPPEPVHHPGYVPHAEMPGETKPDGDVKKDR